MNSDDAKTCLALLGFKPYPSIYTWGMNYEHKYHVAYARNEDDLYVFMGPIGTQRHRVTDIDRLQLEVKELLNER